MRELTESTGRVRCASDLAIGGLTCQNRLIGGSLVSEAVHGGDKRVFSGLLHADSNPAIVCFSVDLKPRSEKTIGSVVPVSGCISEVDAAAEGRGASDLEHMSAVVVNIYEVAN